MDMLWLFLFNLPVLWLVVIVVLVCSGPLVNRFRTWQAKNRFIRTEGAKLENPQNAEACFQLASIYAQGGRWKRAERHIREAIRRAESNPVYEGKVPFHFVKLLGDALEGRGRHAEAVAAYESALRLPSPLGYADVWLGLARARWRLGEAEKALELARRVLEDKESYLEVYFRIAQAAAALGRDAEVREARERFRRVAAMLPRFAAKRRFRWRMAFAFFFLTRYVV